MRAVIFVNGELQSFDTLADLLRPDDYVIAADGGANHCTTLKLTPHALIGDLDSVSPALVEDYRQAHVYIEQHPPDKNQTDLELALDHALTIATERSLTQILLVGAMGGRLDQLLGNILILAQRSWPLPVILVDGTTRAQLVEPTKPLTLAATIGDTVSALPLSDQVTGITYTGMRYPLQDHTLHLGSTRGMSNEVVADEPTVHVATGKLLVITTRDSS